MIAIHAWDGQYIIAKHPDGHCFISVHGAKEAREQLEAQVRMTEKRRAMRAKKSGLI
jgi:hypothetical protein